jgi:hypothetical protein
MRLIAPVRPVVPPTEAHCGTREWSCALIGTLLGLGISLAACWAAKPSHKALVVVGSAVGGGISGYALGCCRRPSRLPPSRPVDPLPEPAPTLFDVGIAEPPVQLRAARLRPEVGRLIGSHIWDVMYVEFEISSWSGHLRERDHDHPQYRAMLDCLKRIRERSATSSDRDRVFELLAALDLDDPRIHACRELCFDGVPPIPYHGDHPTNRRLITALMEVVVGRGRASDYYEAWGQTPARSALTLLDTLINPSTRTIYSEALLADGEFRTARAALLVETPLRQNALSVRAVWNEVLIGDPIFAFFQRWFECWKRQPREHDQNNFTYTAMMLNIDRMDRLSRAAYQHGNDQRRRDLCQTICDQLSRLNPADQEPLLALLQEICCEGTQPKEYPPELLQLGNHLLNQMASSFASNASVAALLRGIPSPALQTRTPLILQEAP